MASPSQSDSSGRGPDPFGGSQALSLHGHSSNNSRLVNGRRYPCPVLREGVTADGSRALAESRASLVIDGFKETLSYVTSHSPRRSVAAPSFIDVPLSTDAEPSRAHALSPIAAISRVVPSGERGLRASARVSSQEGPAADGGGHAASSRMPHPPFSQRNASAPIGVSSAFKSGISRIVGTTAPSLSVSGGGTTSTGSTMRASGAELAIRVSDGRTFFSANARGTFSSMSPETSDHPVASLVASVDRAQTAECFRWSHTGDILRPHPPADSPRNHTFSFAGGSPADSGALISLAGRGDVDVGGGARANWPRSVRLPSHGEEPRPALSSLQIASVGLTAKSLRAFDDYQLDDDRVEATCGATQRPSPAAPRGPCTKQAFLRIQRYPTVTDEDCRRYAVLNTDASSVHMLLHRSSQSLSLTEAYELSSRQTIDASEEWERLGLIACEGAMRQLVRGRYLAPLRSFLIRFVIRPFRARKMLAVRRREKFLGLEAISRQAIERDEHAMWESAIVGGLVPLEEAMYRAQFYRTAFLSYYALARVQLGALLAIAYDELFFLPMEECEARWATLFPACGPASEFVEAHGKEEDDGYYVFSDAEGCWYWCQGGAYYVVDGPIPDGPSPASQSVAARASVEGLEEPVPPSRGEPSAPSESLSESGSGSTISELTATRAFTQGRQGAFGGHLLDPERVRSDDGDPWQLSSVAHFSSLGRVGGVVGPMRVPSPPRFQLIPAAIACSSYAMWELSAAEQSSRLRIEAQWLRSWLAGRARSDLVLVCEVGEGRARRVVGAEEAAARHLFLAKYQRATAIKELAEHAFAECHIRNRISSEQVTAWVSLAQRFIGVRDALEAARLEREAEMVLRRQSSLARREAAAGASSAAIAAALACTSPQ